MAGSDEQLRLIATLTDQWSLALKQMQRSLRSLAAEPAPSFRACQRVSTPSARADACDLLGQARQIWLEL
jgi:hypothetical protein